jgi:hypothetical protein
MNNFEYKKAAAEYDKDVAYEAEFAKNNKKKKN